MSLLVLTDTRNKYDGTRRSPWNEIECGDHYARPMSSFLLFEAASGQVSGPFDLWATCVSRCQEFSCSSQSPLGDLVKSVLFVIFRFFKFPFLFFYLIQDWLFDEEDPSFVKLRFAPRICQSDFRGFFILGSCWGQYAQKGDVGLTNGTVEVNTRLHKKAASQPFN